MIQWLRSNDFFAAQFIKIDFWPSIGGVLTDFCHLSAGMVSLWSLAVIAFERWLVICKPLRNFSFNSHHAIAGCALTWFIALSAALPPLFGWSRSVFHIFSQWLVMTMSTWICRTFTMNLAPFCAYWYMIYDIIW